MTFREYRRTNVTAEPDPNAIEAHLKARGFLIGPGGLGAGLDTANGTSTLLVRVDLDPNIPDQVITDALDAFTPADDPLRTARGYLLTRLAALQAKPLKDLTVVEKDLLAILTVLKALR
jgi:hypothetical protein